MPLPPFCPLCGAVTADSNLHSRWHDRTGTSVHVQDRDPAPPPVYDDGPPTEKLPPIRETVMRRPPPPVFRELTDRAELLRAMATELAQELQDLEDQEPGE